MIEYTDPAPSHYLCTCETCLHEWEESIETDTDEETGQIIYPRPSFCPVCDSMNLTMEEE